MLAQFIRFKLKPNRHDRAIEMLRVALRDIAALPKVHSIHLIWEDNTRGMLFTVFANRAAATTMAIHSEDLWAQLAPDLEEGPMQVTFSKVMSLP